MKNNLPCDIVLDLMPSYIDGLTRETTNAAIGEHLKNCESCKKSYNDMKEPEVVTTTVEEKKEIDFLKKSNKNRKKLIKVFIFWVVFSCIIMLVANVFCGNPISYFLAKNAAEKYIESEYGDCDFEVVDVRFDFKRSSYYALIQSKSSMDSHFDVYISMMGDIQSDNYYKIETGVNTYERINKEYRALVEGVLENKGFMSEEKYGYGTIKSVSDEIKYKYGIDEYELELDKEYDVRELGREAGHIVISISQEEVTVENAAEYILLVKEIMDEAKVPFYAISLTLGMPLDENGEWVSDAPSVYVKHFLYSDIYEEGMVERVQKVAEQLN